MNKYYKPSIDEFHVYFEYDKLITPPNCPECWDQKVLMIEDSLEEISRGIGITGVRVKYLDEGDLEILKFKSITEYIGVLEKEGDIRISTYRRGEFLIHRIEELYHIYNDNNCVIGDKTTIYTIKDGSPLNLFKGSIKNLSRLKEILKSVHKTYE